MNYEIVCDKCGSHNVVKRLANKPEPPKLPVIKMSDVIQGKTPPRNNIHYAVMTYSTSILVCKNCGYKTEPFTENNELGTIVPSIPLKELES